MTYLQFHLVFIVPLLLVLLYVARDAARVLGPRARWTLPAICAIAFAYTTPWDNYLVYRGVWGYGAARVLGTIGYVPLEEYAFFILQPLLVGAWAYWQLMGASHVRAVRDGARHAGNGWQRGHTALRSTATRTHARWVGAGAFAVCAAIGALLLGTERGLYAGLILVWAGPVLAAQWLIVGADVVRAPRLFARMVLPPTLYLWAADRVAIGLGIWHISPRYTTGLHLLGLPVEEALFFLVTTLLIVFGIMLFLRPGDLLSPSPPRVLRGDTTVSARSL